MTRLRGLALTAAVPLFLLGACARPAGGADAGPGAGGEPVTESASTLAPDTVVLRIADRGGFAPPELILGRVPRVSVYADGRVISDGPVPLIYPGPALPNVQLHRIDPAEVRALAEQAVAAGVRNGAEFGNPGVTDVPSTEVTVRTGYGSERVSVIGLDAARPDDGMLTKEQHAMRAKIKKFVAALDERFAGAASQPYRPEAVAVLAEAYAATGDGADQRPVPWPGPALPGGFVSPGVKLGCVLVTGDDKDRVLAAADKANQRTPWSASGRKWSVTFRPLLPDERGCDALKGVS